MRDSIFKMIYDTVDGTVDMCISEDAEHSEWDLQELNRLLIPGDPSEAGDGGRCQGAEKERAEAEAERERGEALRGERDGIPPGRADPGTGAGDLTEGHRPEVDGPHRRHGSAPPGHRPAGLRTERSQGRVQDGRLRYVQRDGGFHPAGYRASPVSCAH